MIWTEYSDVGSIQIRNFQIYKSLIYSKNKRGPIIGPWKKFKRFFEIKFVHFTLFQIRENDMMIIII